MRPWVRVKLNPGSGRGRVPLDPGEAGSRVRLPIYTSPPLQSKYVEEQPGNLQMGFASIRTTTGRYIGWCKGVYVFVKNGIMDTVQFGKDEETGF
ncbi:hypothetical protein QTO34_000755 [Cnephaeus nilssonii]|uniref:Uncharacterized protein n=1 Tax=Cnephaeus nilssonii TaxID=3371016 RepID=A0AA40ID20_CNENI|nr:hypothetical protein QTO34_000755 [Eptesicus nilssonii]